jgi:POT family proton-dependent oligopeptide transporter
MIPEPVGNTAVSTNPSYATLFAQLGWGSTAVGIVLVVLVHFLRKLINERDAPPGQVPVSVVAT